MKLNQKGFTVVEVLLTFVLLSVVMVSLFSTISAFNEKRIQESYRARVYQYKNSVVNRIQADFIQKGLSKVVITRTGSSNASTGVTHTVECTLKDGTERILVVHQRFTKTSFRFDGNADRSDDFYIDYGTRDEMIREEFPNLGEMKGEFETSVHAFVENEHSTRCKRDDGSAEMGPCIQKDFQINNVAISVSNEGDLNVESHVLNIYIGFYSPDLGTKYAINIIAPIDYQKNNNSPVRFPVGPDEFEIHDITIE
jgi:hypothetical protein